MAKSRKTVKKLLSEGYNWQRVEIFVKLNSRKRKFVSKHFLFISFTSIENQCKKSAWRKIKVGAKGYSGTKTLEIVSDQVWIYLYSILSSQTYIDQETYEGRILKMWRCSPCESLRRGDPSEDKNSAAGILQQIRSLKV